MHTSERLDEGPRRALDVMPALQEGPVGFVLLAFEAKACMTEHSKARPRLYDELSSRHLTAHGANDAAIAVAFVMINVARRFHLVTPYSNALKRRRRAVRS